MTKFTPAMLLLAGCGNVTGERPEPPPAPAIAADRYQSAPVDGSTADGANWTVYLAQGGESREADVRRCAPVCVDHPAVPVRAGLNGLALTIPASAAGPALDLAVLPDENSILLVYEAEGQLTERRLRRTFATDLNAAGTAS